MPLHKIRRAGSGSGGSGVEIIKGGTSNVENSDTFNLGNIALNATANAGDLILLFTMGVDGGSSDTSYGISITGFTSVVSDFRRQSGFGNTCLSSHIHKKTATGGETVVAVNGSWTAFGGTMDGTGCGVVLVRGLSSTTEIATATSDDGALTINTVGAKLVCGAGDGAVSATGGSGTFTTQGMGPFADMDYAIDENPPSGASTSYDFSSAGIQFLSSQAAASFG